MSTEFQAAINEFRQHEAIFNQVVEWVCTHGGPAQFPRIVEYLAKNNGGLGWEDTYQNILIDCFCASPWVKPEGGENFRCVVDHSLWHREGDEWRMGAIKESLVLVAQDDFLSRPPVGAPCLDTSCVFFSPDFFRTAGVEPDEVKLVDIHYVVNFLTETVDGTSMELHILSKTDLHKGESALRSWWRRFFE